MPCCAESVCVPVPGRCAALPFGGRQKALSGALALCRAADTGPVRSTLCFTVPPEQTCMTKEPGTAAVLLGTMVPWFWQDSRSSLQLQAAPVVGLFPGHNVVFSKNNL